MRRVTVVFHEERDGWWADSTDMPRYTAFAPTEETLRALVHEGVPFYFEDDAPFEIAEERPPRPRRLNLRPQGAVAASTDAFRLFNPGTGVSRLGCVPEFPSMSASALLRVLMREPLSYRVVRRKGSHRWLVSAHAYPSFSFAFHDRQELSGGVVRKVLVRDVGLTREQALAILRR